MRIAFLSQIVPYPPHGGVLQRGYNLLRELGAVASVHLLAFVHPDELRAPEMIEESRRALDGFCETVEYFPLWSKASALHHAAAIAASSWSSEPFSFVAYRSAAFKRRVLERVHTERFDLVHVDTIALSQFVAGGVQAPTVLTHHNVESKLMERRADVEQRPLARQFLQREARKLQDYEAKVSPRFDMNVMVSEPDEQLLRARVPGLRTAVVPNGVDVGYFSSEAAPDAPTMIYTGGMNMFANRDAVMYFLTEIWGRITAAVPTARFVVVGQDPPNELKQFAARDPRLVVTGYVSDIRPHVNEAAVYVVPLRVGGGTRLKVLDAMAMGKAIVSTPVGCEGIAVRPGEHLLTADTPELFAQSVVDLLGNRARRLELGSAARRLAEQRYAWKVVVGQLLDAYREATANRRDR